MTDQDWSWRIIDTQTNQVERFYNDGAAFTAVGRPHDKSFWDRHPLVERAENVWIGPDDEIKVRVWVRADADPGIALKTTAPERAPDLELTVRWDTTSDFWVAHPDVFHVEVIPLRGDDDPADDAQHVRLWLKG